jgi:hypothetical protein
VSTDRKLKVLKAVSGLFGWGWIIAALIGVYCLVVAVGSGGSWVNVFIAFGTSGISKWLARRFSDSKKRVAFEAEMIFRDRTPEQAAAAVARLLETEKLDH